MRSATICAGFVWVWAALPEVTNAGAELGVYLLLFPLGYFVVLLWLGYSAVAPGVFRVPRVRWLWLSVPVLVVGVSLLTFTHRDLALRVRLCDSELREYAEAVRQHPDDSRWMHRRVGLFVVLSASADENQVTLQTAHTFLDRSGIVYRPDGLPPEYRSPLGSCQYEHLYGPWWRYYENGD